MKFVRIYQILDEVSEAVISTFIAPNARYAVREFNKFLNDPKVKDSFDPSDFSLVSSDEVGIAENFDDSCNVNSVDLFDGRIIAPDGTVLSGGVL